MKKSSLWVIIFVLLLSQMGSFSVQANTASDLVDGDYEYALVNGTTAMITNYTGVGGEIVIPDQLDGLVVTAIGSTAFKDKQLTAVTIPASVVSIRDGAFRGNQLSSVEIPYGVTTIRSAAFQDNQLVSVVIPESVTIIDLSAFHTNLLTEVIIPDSVTEIKSATFFNNKLQSVTLPKNLTAIGASAFTDNELESVLIPDSVTSIGPRAFGNNKLKQITIPAAVTTIDEYTFNNNELASVQFLGDVQSIGNRAFRSNQLTNITLPNSVTIISNQAFASNHLKNLTLPDGLESLEEAAFAGNKLSSVTIPPLITELEDSVFATNLLTNITIPSTVTGIGDLSFASNPLEEIIFQGPVTSVGTGAFLILQNTGARWYADRDVMKEWTDMSQVTQAMTVYPNYQVKVTFTDDGTDISNTVILAGEKITQPADPTKANSTFDGWYTDSSFATKWDFTIGVTADMTLYAKWKPVASITHTLIFDTNGGTAIGNQQVESGERATMPTPPTKAEYTFVGWYKEAGFENEWDFDTDVVTADITLYAKWVPFTYKDDPNDSLSVEITGYASGAPKDVVIPKQLGGKDVTSIGALAFSGKGLTSVTIPDGVTTIGNWAFMDNQLTSVAIPDSVTSIDLYAFNRNKLGEVTIPSSVMSIGNAAFSENRLTSVSIPNSVTSLPPDIFAHNLLKEVTIPSSVTSVGDGAFYFNELEDVALPKGLTLIGERAFSINQLTSVTLPSSVRSIGERAFHANQLTNVTIPSSVESIGDRSFDNNQLNKVVFEGMPTIGTNAFESQNNVEVNWYIDQDANKPWAGNAVTEPMVIYTSFKYNVTFDTNSGSLVKSEKVAPGQKVTKPANPTKAGNTFAGWYEEANYVTEWNFNNGVTKDMTLYAKWTKNPPSSGGGGSVIPTYKLTFDANGGSDVASQNIIYNKMAIQPTSPTKEGHIFTGWYKESDLKTEWDFAKDVVIENTTLYAKWMKNPPSPPSCVAHFTDTAPHFAKKEIDEIACLGIVVGYPDGTFRPNNSITREHVALMFTRAFELTPTRSSIDFNDVPNTHRYYDAITQVYQAGIFDGASNGNFKPDKGMTRAQIAKVLVLAFDLQPSETSTNVFRDVPIVHWANDYIIILADNGIAFGHNGNFKPEESVTRAQFVAFMYRALNL